MKFKLNSSGNFYDSEPEELVKLGFKFRKTKDPLISTRISFYKEKSGDDIEINSLEKLVDFIKEFGEVVMSDDSIEIYDDYRE